MDKSQMRMRPGFLLGLVVFAFFGCLGLAMLALPSDKGITAQKRITMSHERTMAELLQEHAFNSGGLTNITKEFILDSFRTTDKFRFSFATYTNAAGELVDIWQTPYRIEIVGPTNFVIRSAGQNRKFGDADDIVFNSASNDFVKP